jgi:DNA (cytosine-5)-methyltransferase 1
VKGLVLEGFAGPGGWSEGLRAVAPGARVVGIEWDRDACRTAQAAGHPRVRADAATFPLDHLAGQVTLAILSPPCQAWSRSGKRRGILDQASIFAHAQRVTTAGVWEPYADAGPRTAGTGDQGGTWHDARSPLVLEVIRWVLATRPRAVALEQVPDVLPFWRLLARWLGGRGYSTWCGCLSAERFGVPQTRERAILIASTERQVSRPAPTHTAYDPRSGAASRFAGADGDLFGGALLPWVSMADALGYAGGLAVTASGDRQTPGGNVFNADRLSWALTEKVRSWTVATMGDVRASNGTVRAVGCPAGTLTAAMDNGNYRWWVTERPATTGQGDPRVAEPGHRDRASGQRQFSGESVRVSVAEAAVLQSFPADYPWQGSRSAQYRQIGDAIPPLLARAVLAEVLGAAGEVARVA